MRVEKYSISIARFLAILNAMRASTLIVALAAICRAATIPTLATADSNSTASQPDLDKRYAYTDPYWPYSHCSCNNKLNQKDTDDALKALLEQLKSRPRFAGKSIYSISGSTVAFLCRWNNTNQEPVTIGLVQPMLPIIKQRCGSYIAGTVSGTHPEKDPGAGYGFWLGYMQHQKGLDFCRGADSAPARDCPTGLQPATSNWG